MGERIPTIGSYLGCALHDHQTPARLKIVKQDIARIAALSDVAELAEAAADVTLAPEARLLAERKCVAAFELSADERRNRPDVSLVRVHASTAGLNSITWRDPDRFCSLLDAHHELAVEREVPLAEDARIDA